MQAFLTYEEAYREAQALANKLKMDVGIEGPTEYCRPGVTKLPRSMQTYVVRLLPRKENRCGWELRCEVVTPMGG